VNGPNSYSGRLEYYATGEWGTVCDDDFDIMDAKVACKQLGFGLPVAWWSDNNEGTGQIWLDELECVGTESSLGDCAHNGWGDHNCRHSEDISITCQESNK